MNMTIDKTALRSEAMHEVGVRLDDALEAAKAEMLRAEGAIQSSEKAMERAVQLSMVVDKDTEKGELSDEQRQVVKKYLAKCHALMKALHDESNTRMLLARGMVLGMDRAVKTAKQLHDQEQAKVGAAAAVADVSRGRPVGAPPKLSIKQQRLAEESGAEAPALEPEGTNGAHVAEPEVAVASKKSRSKRDKKKN